jgi:hypothetical protein
MSAIIKVILGFLVILLVYGYLTQTPDQRRGAATAVANSVEYRGYSQQTPHPTETTAAQESAALVAKQEGRRRANPSTCLVLQSYKGVAEEYSSSIMGAIKNTCGRTFRYVQITWKLLDKEVWKFKAHAFVADFAKFKLDKISAY